MSAFTFNDKSSKQLTYVASNEEIIACIKQEFKRLDTSSALKLGKLILNGNTIDINIKSFKAVYDSFLKKNRSKFESIDNNGNSVHILKESIVMILKSNILKLVEKIGSSIKDMDDDETKWSKSQIDGVEVYEVTKHTTFQNIREKINKEGKNVGFRYSFKKSDMKINHYENKLKLQLVDIHVNDNGEYFGYPLKYSYVCPECESITTKMEYEVASTSNKILCPEMIEHEGKNGKVEYKRCNHKLVPDNNRTETKDSYIHGISFKDASGTVQRADAITFNVLPKGHIQVVLQKIPRAYGTQFVHVVDYKPLDKNIFPIPKKEDNKHYIFTLIKTIDKYIETNTGYQHYGFLPIKMSMIIQYVSRYVPGFKNNFHVSLSGAMSSGKSQFARYWGLGLYSQDCWSSNATSISIPKLRGTMESFHLFGKDYRYQSRGLLGEKDLIIIDEVKEAPDVKNNLKQYSLEPTYEYSKQGSNNQTFERTAQLIVTQNIDTKHLNRYSKDIMKIYTSTDLISIDKSDTSPKPSWDYTIDLTLPLYAYNNKYLRYSIRKVRDDYARNQINWIDGSELALKQRFYFYFYLGTEKTNQALTDVIRANSTREIISSNIDIIRLLGTSNLTEHFKKCRHLFKGTNDINYFKQVDILLEKYDKRTDARTKEMSYAVLKLIRIIDGRDYCIQDDLKIFQYIIEAIDNKIEVADTNEFRINGPSLINENDIDETTSTDDIYGYKSGLDDFK